MQMLLFHGAPQAASHKEVIAYFGAPAGQAAVSFNKTNHGNRNHHGSRCAARFTADYADFEALRGPTESTIEAFHPFDARLPRSNERNQGELRNGGRGSEIV